MKLNLEVEVGDYTRIVILPSQGTPVSTVEVLYYRGEELVRQDCTLVLPGVQAELTTTDFGG